MKLTGKQHIHRIRIKPLHVTPIKSVRYDQKVTIKLPDIDIARRQHKCKRYFVDENIRNSTKTTVEIPYVKPVSIY